MNQLSDSITLETAVKLLAYFQYYTIPETSLGKNESAELARVGQAANLAAANFLFADYRQRRAKRTIRTQHATLQLWVQYLSELGAALQLLAGAKTWASDYFPKRKSRADRGKKQASALPSDEKRFCKWITRVIPQLPLTLLKPFFGLLSTR